MYQKLREWKGQIDKFRTQKIVISSQMLIVQSKKKASKI